MSHALHEIQRFLFQQARRQSAPLPHLMRFVTDWTVLNAAWRQVRRSQGADTPGADRVVAREVVADPRAARAWLQDLANQIQGGTYRPDRVRRFEIAKPGQPGKTRPLAILTLTDRVAHMALKLVLEPIVEARLGKRCFGFRPGHSRFDELNAVRRVVQNHPDTFTAALTADIASCFDQIDHCLLLDDLRAVVADPGVLALGRRVLEQVGSGIKGWWRQRRVGVLQGSPVSPLLANWNLARFDRAWARGTGEPAPLFRYADDLLVLAGDPRSARRLRPALERCLWRSNRLQLAADKTAVATLDEGVPVLGLMVRRLGDPFDGDSKLRILLDPAKIRDVLDQVLQWAEGLDADRPLGAQFARFNQRLRGWFESYQFAHDAALAFETVDQHVFRAARVRLKDLLGCSAAALQQRHYHRLATGHHTWQADGVALLVLGALPRRYYRPKQPRSPWSESPRPLTASARMGPASPDQDTTMLRLLLDARVTDVRGATGQNPEPVPGPEESRNHDTSPPLAAPDLTGVAPEPDAELPRVPDRNGSRLQPSEPSQGASR